MEGKEDDTGIGCRSLRPCRKYFFGKAKKVEKLSFLWDQKNPERYTFPNLSSFSQHEYRLSQNNLICNGKLVKLLKKFHEKAGAEKYTFLKWAIMGVVSSFSLPLYRSMFLKGI